MCPAGGGAGGGSVRTLVQARSAVTTSKENRSKGKGKVKGKTKDALCLLCCLSDHFWRQCPDRRTKGGDKGATNGARAFYLGTTWLFGSERFEPVVLQADVVLILVDAISPRVEVDTQDRPWFRFCQSIGEGSFSRLAADSDGFD